MANGLDKVLEHLYRALPPPDRALTDGQLLARFVSARDEVAFAALVRRHGPMVLGVCRRLLRHAQDAEDCFQATFLVLARKAASVRGEALGGWLYSVACRTTLEARTANVRRRSRERQVEDLPHPEVPPEQARDWQPLLDHELNLLPEKYRAVIVACDLEGRPRREAAQNLGLSEGTISSRLARGRCLLAKRLSRYGLSLSGGVLAAAMVESAAPAGVPVAMVSATLKAAVGQASVSSSVEILVKGALKAMLLTKLKVAVGAVVVLVAFGASGLVYRAAEQPAPAAEQKKGDGKPRNELEALRRENELLKLNLEVVLEKVRAQGAELRTLRGHVKGAPNAISLGLLHKLAPSGKGVAYADFDRDGILDITIVNETRSDPLREAEAALKALREATDPESRGRAADQLEGALKRLKEPEKPK
ncbi:MAG TPA: sigma-70 family RNA polymerase sigma factor [Gemmataceae bacterium]|nr:sigma-70 family RNA polymerase sigma factor [Gemmataceae bacterium]